MHDKWGQNAIRTIRLVDLPGIPVIPTQSAGATDATYLSKLGIPTYGIPGLWNDPATAGTHGLNERISSDALYRGRDYIHDLVSYFASH